MGLSEIAKQHVARFTSNTDEFGVEYTLTAPDDTTLVVAGMQTMHHTKFDLEGEMVNSLVTSVAFAESFLTEYPYINDDNEIDFTGHKVTFDSVTYMVREFFPDEKVDLIVLILVQWQA